MTEEHTLWCGNLSEKVTDELLYELFLQAGPLQRVTIPKDKDGRQKNYAFITYRYEVSVPYAMYIFQGTALYQRTLRLRTRSKAILPPPIRFYDGIMGYNPAQAMQRDLDMTDMYSNFPHASYHQSNDDHLFKVPSYRGLISPRLQRLSSRDRDILLYREDYRRGNRFDYDRHVSPSSGVNQGNWPYGYHSREREIPHYRDAYRYSDKYDDPRSYYAANQQQMDDELAGLHCSGFHVKKSHRHHSKDKDKLHRKDHKHRDKGDDPRMFHEPYQKNMDASVVNPSCSNLQQSSSKKTIIKLSQQRANDKDKAHEGDDYHQKRKHKKKHKKHSHKWKETEV